MASVPLRGRLKPDRAVFLKAVATRHDVTVNFTLDVALELFEQVEGALENGGSVLILDPSAGSGRKEITVKWKNARWWQRWPR